MLNSIDALNHVGTKAKLEVRGGRVKKIRHEPELEEQAALVAWADKTVIDGIKIGEYLIHIPNEGKRGPKAARDAKRLGLRPGVPDLFLAVPRGGFSGLWIEMKSSKGRITEQQLEWVNKLISQKYRVIIAKGYSEAKNAIEEYFLEGL